MAEQIKEMKITPVSCRLSERKLNNGGKIYDLVFKPAGVDMEMTGATFSDTLAKGFEDNIGKEVDAKFNVREYQGRPSYSLSEIAGIQKGNFKGARGIQKDVVSIERQSSAKMAIELMQVLGKNTIKDWEKTADAVFAWISKRPSEPQADGGVTPQKTPDNIEGNPEDIPFKD